MEFAALNSQLSAAAQGTAQVCDGIWRQSFCLSPDFVGFQGHFPDNPILPAVTQIQAGVLLAAHSCGKAPRLASLSRAKFMRPIRPSQLFIMLCKPAADSSFAITITMDKNIAASFTLTLQE